MDEFKAELNKRVAPDGSVDLEVLRAYTKDEYLRGVIDNVRGFVRPGEELKVTLAASERQSVLQALAGARQAVHSLDADRDQALTKIESMANHALNFDTPARKAFTPMEAMLARAFAYQAHRGK